MNIMIKRISAAALCLLMMLSFCASVFADENDGTGAVAGENASADATAVEESSGIIDSAALKSMIDTYVKENGLSGNNKVFSIGYCYTATGDTWYYDADQWCYSASLYKVPCCMLLAEKEYNGEITADTQINSQYASGTVEHMEQRSLVYSDNYTGHAVVEYLGGTYSGKCAEQTIKFTDLPEDYFPADFSAYSYYSAKYYTQVLNTLYNQSDKYPRIMDYMKQDQNYHYLDLQLNGQYETAQKYGAFEEKNGNKNYHSAGIIYTPNPIIVTIMTKNITSFEKHIGNVAKMLVDYTLQLDSELATYKANLVIAQQEEQARLAREEQERLAAEAAAQQAAAAQAAQTQTAQTQTASQSSIFIDTPQQTVTPVAGKITEGEFPAFTLPVIIGLAVLALIFLIVFIVKLRKAKLEEDEYDEEDYEDYMRGDLSELAPRQDKKKSAKRGRKGRAADDYDEEYDDDYDEAYDDRYEKRGKKRYKEDRYEDDRYEDEYYEDDRYEDERFEEDRYEDDRYTNDGYEDIPSDRPDEEFEENYDEQYDDGYQDDYRGGYDDGYADEEYDDYRENVKSGRSSSSTGKIKSAKSSKAGGLKSMFQRKKAQAVEYEDDEEELYGEPSVTGRGNSRYSDISEEDFRRYGLGRSNESDDASDYGDAEDYSGYGDYEASEDYGDAGDYSDYHLADYDLTDSDSDADDYLSDYTSDDRYSPRH
ncbi:MAG: serine hydrolase [Eubacteriales bacterium]|nr:serine hydrolase [Eubacteriales bacterium]